MTIIISHNCVKATLYKMPAASGWYVVTMRSLLADALNALMVII